MNWINFHLFSKEKKKGKRTGYAYAVINCKVLIIGCRLLVIFLSKSQLAVEPTCAFYIVALLIWDKVIWFGFLGLVIHFANIFCMFEVTTLARWISITMHIAGKQSPNLLSFIGVAVECFAINWHLINFALLAICLPCKAKQRPRWQGNTNQ